MRRVHHYMICPKCDGTGRTVGKPIPGMPVALARACNPPCSGCHGLGSIPIKFYQSMLDVQRLVRKVCGAR